ncbi:hypothetical protein GCM10022224_058650 [Nonomuraea antimicrobica]|uniref:Lipoprotein n=2 Tax=Nonomuraea antimicrobica TaxID=561173 RepID=A0ABP7CBA0_9ACTN
MQERRDTIDHMKRVGPGRLRRPVTAALLLLATACASPVAPPRQSAQHHATAPAPVATAAPAASIEELASKAACTSLKVQTDAAELRQAACQTAAGRYTIVTFATEKGKREWLDAAQMYGGTYLVGEQWAVVASMDLLHALQQRVGGDVEAATHTMPGM